MHGGFSYELGKITLGPLLRRMCTALLSYSLRLGQRVQSLSNSLVVCNHVFIRFCFGSSSLFLVGIVRKSIRSLQGNGIRLVSLGPEYYTNDAMMTRLV